MKLLKICMYALIAAVLTGCASSRLEMGQSTQTSVSLKESNYTILKPGAIGSSYGFKLLGIIPFAGSSYSKARANLYRDLKISLEGKSVALANTTQDSSSLYFLLFSLPKKTVQADVVQFNAVPAAMNAGKSQ